MLREIRKIRVSKGKKKLIPFLGRFSPEVDNSEEFYQKKLKDLSYAQDILQFIPSAYNGRNSEEKRKLAYEDAKRHVDFYKDLIKRGVYPKGTTVKAKKMKNSDVFLIEFFMPKIKMIKKNSKVKQNIYDQQRRIMNAIEDTAISYGYSSIREIGDRFYSNFHRDIEALRNYGVDKEGNLRYVDSQVLMGKLPFKGTVLSESEIKRLSEKYDKSSGLEKRVLIFVGSIVSGIILSISSLNTTGSAIGTLGTTQGLLGIFLFIFGLVGIVFGKK